MGDRDGSTIVTTLGCIDGRHYSDGFGVWNRSHGPLTVLSVHWRSPASGNIEWSAAQVRRGLYRPGVDEVISRNWSARPTGPVTIPPGREATVQSNFVFGRCSQLAGGRSVRVPGSLIIRYRAAGRVRQQLFRPGPALAFVLVAGPTRQSCAAVSGSTSLIASNISCAAAQHAALVCHFLSHNTYGACFSGNVRWSCDWIGGHDRPHVETCDEETWSPQHGGARTYPRGFKVRWNPLT
jgi:hypothetical protein